MILIIWVLLYNYNGESFWWSSFADDQSKIDNCHIGDLYSSDQHLAKFLDVSTVKYFGKTQDIEVCTLMCCEKERFDAAIFQVSDQKCYFMNCDQSQQLCEQMKQKMNHEESLNVSKPVSIYFVTVAKGADKRNYKRETFISSDIIQPLVSPNLVMNRPRNGPDNSIVDRIIKEEVKEIQKTLNDTLKVNQEILKRRNILKTSKEHEKLQELNVLDDKKGSAPKTPLMNFYMTPLFLGCAIGAIGLVVSVIIILIVLKRRKCQQPMKRDESKETENPEDLENK